MDKKAQKGKAKYVLPALIGFMYEEEGKYAVDVDEDVVNEAIELLS
jgi:hypothetical protein